MPDSRNISFIFERNNFFRIIEELSIMASKSSRSVSLKDFPKKRGASTKDYRKLDRSDQEKIKKLIRESKGATTLGELISSCFSSNMRR